MKQISAWQDTIVINSIIYHHSVLENVTFDKNTVPETLGHTLGL